MVRMDWAHAFQSIKPEIQIEDDLLLPGNSVHLSAYKADYNFGLFAKLIPLVWSLLHW